MDRDRFNIKKLPEGMTHGEAMALMEGVFNELKETGRMTDELETAFRYVGRLIADAQIEELIDKIGKRC